MTELKWRYGTLCTLYFDTPEERLEELMEKAATTSPPSSLASRDLYYEPGDITDFELLYSNGPAESPRLPAEHTAILSTVIDEEIFHVHSYWDPEMAQSVISYQESLLSSLEEVNARISVAFSADTEYETLVNSIDGIEIDPQVAEVDTVSMVYDSWDVRLFAEPFGPTIAIDPVDIDEVEPSDLNDEVHTFIDQARQKLEEMIS